MLFFVEDFRVKLTKIYYDPDFSIASRNSYVTEVLPVWLGYFEKLARPLDKESNKSFFVGNHLTWIDYIMFELIDKNVEFVKHTRHYLQEPDVVRQDILENFPKLRYFFEMFSQRPSLRKYLSSPARLPFLLPYPPSLDVTKSKKAKNV